LRAIEVVMAVVFGALGVRSLVYWLRQPFTGGDALDHALFALFVLGRAGIWLGLAALFAMYASTSSQGRAFVDDAGEFAWMVPVLLCFAVLQVVAGYFLGHRRAGDA
jgi:hypothetical protein